MTTNSFDYIDMFLMYLLGMLIYHILCQYNPHKKNKFTVYQQMHMRDEIDEDGIKTTFIDTYMRFVDAKTEEEAIGKFLADTRNVKCLKRYEINCVKNSDYKII